MTRRAGVGFPDLQTGVVGLHEAQVYARVRVRVEVGLVEAIEGDEHLGRDVEGEDAAGALGESPREEALPTADLDDGLPGEVAEVIEDGLGLLPGFAVEVFVVEADVSVARIPGYRTVDRVLREELLDGCRSVGLLSLLGHASR